VVADANRRPLVLAMSDFFGKGSFGDIFFSEVNGKACKLFVKYDYDDQLADRSEDRMMQRRAVCSSEIEAYHRVQSSPLLVRHTPQFLGHRPVQRVIGPNGEDFSSRYLLDCCYEIAFVKGKDEKLSAWGKPPEYVNEVLRAFQEIGVTYLNDSSVFDLHDPEQFCIIDFGIEDRHRLLDIEIARGGLSEEHVKRWSRELFFRCGAS